jgi:hypothetical protein
LGEFPAQPPLVEFENGDVAAVDPEIKFEKFQTLQTAL